MARMQPKSKDGNWTIYDIAHVAGVSAKTVSRVVNGEAGVGPDTRARIAKIIEEVRYQPHTGARSMRHRTRDCLGVAISLPVNEAPVNQDFLLWIFQELYRLFLSRGYFAIWDMSPPSLGDGLDYARTLWQQRCGGLAVIGPLAINDTTIHRVHESGCPYMTLGRLDSLPEVSFAAVDLEEGAYVSTKYLLNRGHKNIGMLKSFRGFQPSIERRRGYLRALEEAGLPPDEKYMRPVSFGTRDIVNAVHRLLLDPKVTAIIECSGCEDAPAIREGARRAGRVPNKDFEIVCWTYTSDGMVMSEACAHVWLPVKEAAAEGFELLAQWFAGEREGPIQLLYPPTLHEKFVGKEISKPLRLFDMLSE